MSKRREVKIVRRSGPLTVFLAHLGLFLAAHSVMQWQGYIVVSPVPVRAVQMEEMAQKQDGGWLSELIP